jgi:hypothetical protein
MAFAVRTSQLALRRATGGDGVFLWLALAYAHWSWYKLG